MQVESAAKEGLATKIKRIYNKLYSSQTDKGAVDNLFAQVMNENEDEEQSVEN